jgi:SAM-dependent methyltransferase
MTTTIVDDAVKPGDKAAFVELFLLSLASLFVELLIIRWISADIRAFTIFKTFPLVTCFVGLGVGMAIPADKWFRYTPAAILQTVLTIKAAQILMFRGETLARYIFPSMTTYQWADFEANTATGWLYVGTFMLVLMFYLAGPFAICLCLGNRLGQLFGKMKPLTAYSLNVAGALAGGSIFGLCSYLSFSPGSLWILPAAIIAFYLLKLPDAQVKVKVGLVTLLFISVASSFWIPKDARNANATTFWSPYQKIDVVPCKLNIDVDGHPQSLLYAVEVRANWLSYQWGMNIGKLKEMGLNDAQLQVFAAANDRYSVPFLVRKPKETLIVGAGSGTDVCQALNFDAEHIDAVDIDPIILSIGKSMNPGHPYLSPKVNPICDDARHYFDTCKKKYDLIVFGLLDSQTVVGMGSSIRVDNFVYTKESFQKVMTLLKPGGLVVLTFGAPYDFLGERLFCTIKEATGYAPIVIRGLESNYQGRHGFTYIFGQDVKDGTLKLPTLPTSLYVDPMTSVRCGRLLTDDWPYLYLNPDGIDIPYILVVAEVLLLSLYVGRKLLFTAFEPRSWQLFFQGAAFMLLELQAISRLALVWGATWLTTSIVINCVLLMILIANFVVAKFKPFLERRESAIWMLLFLLIFTSYFLPMDAVLHSFGSQVWIGQILVTLVTVLPIFGAGLIFAIAFSGIQLSARALAFNLFGAVVGAMLEYLSNSIGINNLVLVAVALYSMAFVCYTQFRKQTS